jgi:hypothetical protein
MQMVTTGAEEKRYAELQALALDFARDGETEPLAEMLRHGLPVDLSDAKGNSLLMLASYHGQVDTVRMLLDHGADVDRRNDRGQTPLGGVAFKGDEAVVGLVLDYGASVDADNGAGLTPIMFAAMFGRTRVVEQLRARGASLDRRNRLGISARLMVKLSRWLVRLFGRPPRACALRRVIPTPRNKRWSAERRPRRFDPACQPAGESPSAPDTHVETTRRSRFDRPGDRCPGS